MLTGEPPRVPKPASKSPWYVLATIHGEQTEEGWNEEVAAKNRRIWNGWSCGHLPKAKRAELAKLAKLDEAALEAWSETERAHVEKVFATGRGMGMVLPDPEAAVDFKDTHFETPLSMSQFVFTQAVVFTSATFDGYAWFDSTTFSGDAWFGSATFNGDAWFGSARFSCYAWFDHATFSGEARFSSATVSGDAVFSGATFGGDTWFDGAKFTGYAWFDSATFSGDAWFDSATFSGDAWFGNATFERFANFTGATFEKIASFSDCQFGRTTSFREARFQGAFPRFSGAILHQNTIFTAKDRFWPAMSSVEPEASRDLLAVIRHAIAKQGLPEEEHYFFRREMRFRAKIGTVFERLPYILYQELSDFGNSIVRPTVGLLALWVTFGLAYWLGYYGHSKLRACCLPSDSPSPIFSASLDSTAGSCRMPSITPRLGWSPLQGFSPSLASSFSFSSGLACGRGSGCSRQCQLKDGRRPASLWRRHDPSVVTDARPAVGARCQ